MHCGMMKVYSAAVLVVAAAAACCASPIVQPAPVYGPPGAFQRFQLARAMAAAPADYVLAPPPPPAAPAPAWSVRPPPPPQQQHVQQQQYYQQAAQQQYYRPQPLRQLPLQQDALPPPQQQQQQYMMGLQGIWRYTVPVRAAPIREDQAPHQGLGASDSVTMPEAAPYDPLLVTGPAAAHFVRVLSDNEPHYFPAFPHTRLVLSNQQKRLDNGLNANRLGSIRPGSDFFRGD